MSLGVFHWSKDNRRGARASIESFKNHNPNIPYYLVNDGGCSYFDICIEHGVEYQYSNTCLGYPSAGGRGDRGYDCSRVIAFMTRILMACHTLNTTHLVISEDDVICLNPIKYEQEWQFAAYNVTDGNLLQTPVLEYIYKQSYRMPNHLHYCAGAGTIINCATFIRMFPKFLNFMYTEFDGFRSTCQPQLGWNDCFIMVFFYLAGCDYIVNPRLHNIWPENPNTDLNELAKHYDMVHNYKNFYEGR